MIDIKKLDKAKVLVALYNNSKQLGYGVFDERGYYKLPYEEAVEILEKTTFFDYLYGRVLKVDLSKDSFDERLYDRDNGEGAAKRIIDGLKKNPDNYEMFVLSATNTIDFDSENETLYGLASLMEERFREQQREEKKYCDISNLEINQSDEEKNVEKQVLNKYDRVIFLKADQGVLFVVKDGKYGAVSAINGEVIIDCLYDKYFEVENAWYELGCPKLPANTSERSRKK